MPNKLLNFRCPEPLLEAIDKIGRSYYPADNESGCDRSKTLIDIIKAGVEALTNGEDVVPLPGNVRQGVRQITEADIRAIVEAVLSENKSAPTVQVQNNIPTRDELHDLKDLVNGFKLGLMREIQNRDKSIGLLAEQVAEITARLDNGTVTHEVILSARETVLKNWRSESAPKKERIEEALDQFIDIIENPDLTEVPMKVEDVAPPNKSHMRVIRDEGVSSYPDSEIEEFDRKNDRIPKSVWRDWEDVCTDSIDDLRAQWYGR